MNKVTSIVSNNSRGKLLIDNRVQLSLVRRVSLHWLTFMALFLLVVFSIEVFLRDPETSLVDSFVLSLQKHSLMFVLMIAIMPAFLYDTVKMSNRFAGPISRLKYGLSALASGEKVEEINFRKGDFWGELAEDFNKVAQRVQTKTTSEPSSTTEIAKQTESLG